MTSHRTILYYSTVPGEADADRFAALEAALAASAGRHGAPAPRRSAASLAGLALALRALAASCGRTVGPEELRFATGAKPRGPEGHDFSVSHAGPWVAAVALAGVRIGLDIETHAADRLSLRRVCDAAELEAMRVSGAAAMWVAKEAALKAWGLGLREAPRVRIRGATATLGDETLRLYPVAGLEGVRICLASSAPLAPIELRRVDCVAPGDHRQFAPHTPPREPHA